MRATQSTPPLYFWIAWVWAHVFGYGEVGLRSLSAVFGTATIPAVALIARRFAGDRGGLLAGALVATSPVLVWYSQEARAYSLFVLLCAVSIGCTFALRSRPTKARLVAWTGVSLAAIATHYFAGFVVIAEACVLLTRPGPALSRRALLPSLVTLGAVAIPLGILAHEQYPNSVVVQNGGLAHALVQSAGQLLVGYGVDSVIVVCGVLVAVGLAVSVWAFLRRPQLAVADFWPLVVMTGLVIFGPVVVGLAGSTIIDTRNLLYMLLPIAVMAAAGAVWSRARWAVALPVAAGLAVVIHVDSDPTLQRTNFAGAAQAIRAAPPPTAILIRMQGLPWFQPYLPRARTLGAGGERVANIVMLGMTTGGGLNREVEPLDQLRFTAPPGFRQVLAKTTSTYTVRRFEAARPQLVTAGDLARRAGGNVELLLAP